MNGRVAGSASSQADSSETSYKFQRLREKLRRSIASGDLNGKLPGERALARRFHVNAKTLSKALTDLAAEGVLHRSIGRGTFVRGSDAPPAVEPGRWLILCDPGEENACTVAHLRAARGEVETVLSVANLRPSFLNQFSAVVDLAESTPESFLRQLLVRNMPVVGVNYEPRAYSIHSVLPDVALGVSRLARDLLLAGHRHLGVIEPRGGTTVCQTARQVAARYASDAVIDSAMADDAPDLVEAGVTALICGSVRQAKQTRLALSARNIFPPARVSVAAVGCACPDAGCSGYFVECRQIADAVVQLLGERGGRPVTLWLSGAWHDRGTLSPYVAHPHAADQPLSMPIAGAAL